MTVSEETVKLGEREVPCRVLTWKRGGRVPLVVRFLAPRTQDPNRQVCFPEPLLKHWAAQDSRSVSATAKATAERAVETFFGKVIDEGYLTLQQSAPDGAGVPPYDEFRMMKSLFQNRLKGAVAVKRKLRSAGEMVRSSTSGYAALPDEDRADLPTGKKGQHLTGRPVEVIVPGLGGDGPPMGGATSSPTAGDALRSALESRGVELEAGTPLASAAKHYIQRTAFDDIADQQAGAEGLFLLKRPFALDNFTTVGLYRTTPWNGVAAINAVGGGLLAGEARLSEDLLRYQASPYAAQVRARFIKAAAKPATAFAKWLGTVRETGFVRLLGTDFPDVPRDEELRGSLRTDYRALLWQAYQLMARCYGAWAWRVWIDFRMNNPAGQPTPEEDWLFRNQNFPNIAFAGLPLAFLSPAQLSWVQGILRVAWYEGAGAWGKYKAMMDRLYAGEPLTDEPVPKTLSDLRGIDGALYDSCTVALAVYSGTAETVRTADRVEKQHQRDIVGGELRAERARKHATPSAGGERNGDGPSQAGAFHAPDDADVFEYSTESLTCPECGRKFDHVDDGTTKSGHPAVLLHCGCGSRWFKLGSVR